MVMPEIIPQWKELKKSQEIAEKWGAGFEYNDFFLPDILDDKEELNRRIQTYRGLNRDRKRDTLHGAFFDLAVNSSDSKIAEISRMRMRQSMEVGEALQVRGVVFHTNLIAGFNADFYIQRWLEYHEHFLRQLSKEYQGIEIYVENMFDREPDKLAMLAERLKDTSVGVCFDVAHSHLTDVSLEAWIRTLLPYIRHFHINDNLGKVDSHSAVGTGSIDWKKFSELAAECTSASGLLVEVSSPKLQEESLRYMKEKGIYPFS